MKRDETHLNLWIGDYLKLSNEIHYLEFKLTDDQLSSGEIEEARFQLNERLQREGEFKIIVNSFDDLDSRILCMRYIDDKTLENIAYELGYSASYIYKKHAQIMKSIGQFETIHTELMKFHKNFPRKNSKK